MTGFAPTPIWRCAVCRARVEDHAAHRPHDDDCTDDTFCRCERNVVCAACCSCARDMGELPGQTSLLGDDAA